MARVTAPTRLLLTAERTALNLLCHLSGVATPDPALGRRARGHRCDRPRHAQDDARVSEHSRSTPCVVAVERTTGWACPTWRWSRTTTWRQPAVSAAAYARVRALEATIPVEIEVDSLDGLREAIEAGADEVLIDNFTLEQMRDAVRLRNELGSAVRLEASGGLTLDTARAVAETGVDLIAVGELTHSARVLDLGLDLRSIV